MKKNVSTLITIAVVLLSVPYTLYAQQVKRLYIAIDDHTDYMWTANEVDYDSAFVHMLDYYLDEIDATKDNPSDFQARFNCDGSIWLQAYQKHRTAKQFDRLIAAIKSGHISSPLNAVINCFGSQPTEAVIRGMFYAGQLERDYDVRFRMAGGMENNTIPLGLSSLWAGSGAKYSWYGIGGYASQMSYEYRENRRNQLYRYTGLDSSSVIMKWYTYQEGVLTPFGSYAETRTTFKSTDVVSELATLIPRMEKMADTISAESKYPYNAVGNFGYGHDDLETYRAPEFIQVAQNTTTPERKVRVSVLEDFFEDIGKNYPSLPSETLSYGNEWDLYTASMNETTAKMRRSTEKLRTAEALATIVSLKKPGFDKQLKASREKAWDSFGLYWEHDWTADSKVAIAERADWQIRLQENLENYVDSLQLLSADHLGSLINSDNQNRFYVFNPLSWERNDYADFEYSGQDPVRVIDLTDKKEVPNQLIQKGDKTYIRIAATNIPSMGYKVFEIQKGNPKQGKNPFTISGEYVSNEFFKVRLSPSGAITEIIDLKANNRQLVNTSNGRFVNGLGVNDPNVGSKIEIENEGPVSVTLKAISNDPVKHTVRVTLFADLPMIEIQDSIQENFRDVNTWSFDFDLNKPTTRHEELGAILTVKTEDNGGHYSSQQARYDWQTFNHFATLSEDQYGVTISNIDCSFFSLGESGVYSLDETSSYLQALAGGQVDTKWEDGNALGFPNQNGQTDFLYQFALKTHQGDFDPIEEMRFSLEHQNPLFTGKVTGDHLQSNETTYSLLTIDNPDVLLWSVKPAEEGIEKGIMARCWNMNANPLTIKIKLKLPIQQAWQTTHIETDLVELEPSGNTLPVDFNQHQLKTFRIIPRK
ncbi:glycosyl hydrolase-related protein [Pararhodonellum marinum]|uniref:glycosyl hydrolase-related protein n=1 Tax=Pararhodonellum marinum TaxID=2755358 RepID=UPI00188ED090|nr:glycosyl hydrolase-related protein [Pararhodonellum marinum]